MTPIWYFISNMVIRYCYLTFDICWHAIFDIQNIKSAHTACIWMDMNSYWEDTCSQWIFYSFSNINTHVDEWWLLPHWNYDCVAGTLGKGKKIHNTIKSEFCSRKTKIPVLMFSEAYDVLTAREDCFEEEKLWK